MQRRAGPVFAIGALIFLTGVVACGGGGSGGGPPVGGGTPGGGESGNAVPGVAAPGLYGEEEFEVSRGPFGGDRTSIVIDPGDSDRLIANSCDRSGIWFTGNGGKLWTAANPAGAPFERESTEVALIPADGAKPAEVLVAVTTEHALSGSFFTVDLADPASSAVTRLPGGKSRVRLLTADPDPARPGRIAAVAYSLGQPKELWQGNVVFSPDRGASWWRWFAGGRFHIPLAISFCHGPGRLLIASAGSIDPAELQRFHDEKGPTAVMEMINRLEVGLPVDPNLVLLYGIDTIPSVRVVNPFNGVSTSPGTLLAGSRVEAIALDPALPGVIWFCHGEGLARSDDDGTTAAAVNTWVPEIQAPLPSLLTAMGLSVMRDPTDGRETLFLCLGGRWAGMRGIRRLTFDPNLTAWKVERVSPGASGSFLDYPKGPVRAAPTNGQVLYAPYSQDAILVSRGFGGAGTWSAAMEGMTGFNVFGVTEDPFDPRVVMCTGQNLIRRNESRLTDSEWFTTVIQTDRVAANLRAGVIVDPDDRRRRLVGGGGGAAINLNGGVWLTTNGGATWTRALGDDATPEANPQIFSMLQHPGEPDLVVAAGCKWLNHGTPGVWASLRRGEPGSFERVLEDGQYRATAPIEISAIGPTLVGGEAGLALLRVEQNKVVASKLSWIGGAITALAATPAFVYAGTAEGKLYRSSLTGIGGSPNWYFVDDFPSGVAALALSDLRPGEFYVGTAEDGIFRSVDGGGTFAPFDDGLESSERVIYCLLISSLGDRLYAGTLGGLAVRRLD